MATNTLKDLCHQISIKFQNGISLISMLDLVEKYHGTDWKDYIQYFNDSYHKELIFQENAIDNSDHGIGISIQKKSFDVYIISWKAGQSSKIHDHPIQGCLMKVLDGTLEEQLYNNTNQIVYLKTNKLEKDNICYHENNLILHKIIPTEDSVSLHIYSPAKFQQRNY